MCTIKLNIRVWLVMAEGGSDEGSSKVEYEVIKENLSLIVGRLEHELNPMCLKFFEKSLISEHELGKVKSQDKHHEATEVMRSILTKVKGNKKFFNTFISTFEGSMEDLAKKLKADLEKKKDQHLRITSQSNLPFVGYAELPSESIAELRIADEAPKLEVLPTASTNLEVASVDWQLPESVSGSHKDNAASAQPVAAGTEELQHTHNSATVFRHSAVDDVDHVIPQLPKVSTQPSLNHSTLSYSEMVESTSRTPLSEPAPTGDIFGTFPIQEESEGDDPRVFSYSLKEPLEKVKDQKFWTIDHWVERALSSVEGLKEELAIKKKEEACWKGELEKNRAELVKCKAKTREVTDERNQALEEKDQALEVKDQALLVKDRALEERDQALQERDRTLEEKDQALLVKDQAQEERDQAQEERDQALQERDQARVQKEMSGEGDAMKLKEVTGNAQLILNKVEREKDKIIAKLRLKIGILERDLKFEKSFAEKNGELYARAAEQLKETTEILSKESSAATK